MDILANRGVSQLPGAKWLSLFRERHPAVCARVSRTKDQERAGIQVEAVAHMFDAIDREEKREPSKAVHLVAGAADSRIHNAACFLVSLSRRRRLFRVPPRVEGSALFDNGRVPTRGLPREL